MPHTPTDMSKWWTRSSCKLCQKLVISPFQSEISDGPAGSVLFGTEFSELSASVTSQWSQNGSKQIPGRSGICTGFSYSQNHRSRDN